MCSYPTKTALKGIEFELFNSRPEKAIPKDSRWDLPALSMAESSRLSKIPSSTQSIMHHAK
jgi:hypothetical protein